MNVPLCGFPTPSTSTSFTDFGRGAIGTRFTESPSVKMITRVLPRGKSADQLQRRVHRLAEIRLPAGIA